MNQQPGQQHDIQTIKAIWKYLRPYRLLLLLVFISLCITSTSVLLISQALRYVIDNGLSKGDPAMLDYSLLYLLAIVIVLGLATALRYYFITMVGEKVAIDMRRDLYKHILELSVEFYESHKAGDILTRIVGDITELQTLIGSSISMALRNAVMLMGGIVMMMLLNTKLFMIIMIAIPFVVLPIVAVGRYVSRYSRLSQDRVGSVAALAEETIAGIKTVQAYCQESFERERFEEGLSSVLEASTTRMRYRAVTTLVVILMVFGGIVYLLWVGGHDVLKGEISPGALSSFLFLGVVCAAALGALVEIAGDLQKANGAAARILEFLYIKPKVASRPDAQTIKSGAHGRIRLDNVTFFYESRPDKPILQDISFEITPKKITAIVGKSGAGKSTVIQLLLRFYDIQSGVITFDGIDVKELDLPSLRQQFAYVSQDPVIFSTNVMENIRYGNQDATELQVREALRAAAALDFVERLPDGLQTYLGEKGLRLSGGQKQRIAIARAFLKNPRILLLDEATSSLDSSNESIVQMALENLMADRTVVVIAHRLSTIIGADKIVVLDNGRIVEQGRHDYLLEQNGVYAKLFIRASVAQG
ncbi:MAG: ATP-binding cassette domain-containing protein [Proteobacteria bacterium]|nr:ATP-binding cassette domain-containing protein [Pseudomonadota bacterium]